MDFYLIHSIKGGCGKTTIALRVASQLAMKGGRKICLLDVDFKGTGLIHLLLDSGPQRYAYRGIKKPDDFAYWNQCFSDPTVDFSERMLICVEGEEESGSGGARFQIAVSDPQQLERDKFIGNASPTDGLAINVAIFRFRLLEVIKKLKDLKYTDVVLDLPPSFDEYTKGIFQEFFSKDSRDGAFLRKKENRIILYLVTSYDKSHFYSTRDFLTDYIKRPRHRHKQANQVKVVFNDVSNSAGGFSQELIDGLFDNAYSELLLNSADHLIKIGWKQEMAEGCSIFVDKAKDANLIALYAMEKTHDAKGDHMVAYDDLIAKPDEKSDTERRE